MQALHGAMRRYRHAGAVVCALVILGAAPVGAQAIDLAPTGQLRVAVSLANPAIATKDPTTREWRGIFVDLSRALAQRLGVPATFVEYATDTERDAARASGAWDIGSTAAPDQAAAPGLAVAVPYLDVDNTLLVGRTLRSRAPPRWTGLVSASRR